MKRIVCGLVVIGLLMVAASEPEVEEVNRIESVDSEYIIVVQESGVSMYTGEWK